MKKELLIYIATFIISILIIEFGFRFASSILKIYDVEMYKYALKLQQKSDYPGLTHEHISNKKAHLMGVEIAINSIGLRDKELDADDSQKRLLFIGSSITLGWGTPYESVFTSLLEQKLKKRHNLDIINAGVGNYNTHLESLFLQKLYPKINPDIVFLHYYINDLETVKVDKLSGLLKKSYAASFLYMRIKQIIELKQSNYSSIGEYYNQMYSHESKKWQSTQKTIIAIKDFLSKKETKLIICIQPDLHDLSKESPQAEVHSTIKKFLLEHKIDYIDLLPVFNTNSPKNIKDLWVAKDDSHPNIEGHKIMFKGLYQKINELLE